MPVFLWVWIALVCLVLLVWVSRHRLLSAQKGRADVLTPDSPGVETDPPRLSVLVSAKDEE